MAGPRWPVWFGISLASTAIVVAVSLALLAGGGSDVLLEGRGWEVVADDGCVEVVRPDRRRGTCEFEPRERIELTAVELDDGSTVVMGATDEAVDEVAVNGTAVDAWADLGDGKRAFAFRATDPVDTITADGRPVEVPPPG